MKLKTVLAAAAMTASLSGFGVDVKWINYDAGAHDLADGANWEGGTVPELPAVQGTDYTAQILAPSAKTVPPNDGAAITMTASRDLVLRDFTFANNDWQLTTKKYFDVNLDLGADRTITFWGGQHAAFWFNLFVVYQRTWLKSGTLKGYDAFEVPSPTTINGTPYYCQNKFRMTATNQGPVEMYVDGPTAK